MLALIVGGPRPDLGALIVGGPRPDLAAFIVGIPYMERAFVELMLLAVLAGTLGSWIVLRRLAFYTHAVGTATFPGLVVAVPWGVAPQLTALAAALGFGTVLERLARNRRLDPGAATGLLLVAALAGGAVLASDVYTSAVGVDQLLFGSLIGLQPRDLWLTAAATAAALAAHGALHRSWLATGFDPGSAGALGVRTTRADRVLLAATAVAVVVSLDAVGALLVAVVLVVPAATVRLVVGDVRTLQLGTIALAAAEGVAALLIADSLNVGPGPVLAVLGALVFAAVAVTRR
jgi:ABC-type Mn2+/Zn2+ transport system permease subunit